MSSFDYLEWLKPAPDKCIERKEPSGSSWHYSVAEYDEAQQSGILDPQVRRFGFGLSWTPETPPVEQLTTDWKWTREGAFRIRKRDVYEAQMRQLIGID